MQIGKWAGKQFDVSASRVLTFDGFSLSGSLRTSDEDAAGKKPATTVKGAGLLKLSLTVKLNAALGAKVQSEIDSWMALQDAGKAYPFVLCGKAVGVNAFLLTSCKVSDVVIGRANRQPILIMADLALDFTEYLPPGLQKGTGGAATASAVAASGAVAVNNAYRVPSAAEKGDMKRTNPGMGGSQNGSDEHRPH